LWVDGRVAQDARKAVGTRMYKALGAGGQRVLNAGRNFASEQGAAISYVLRFPSDADWLAALPWELLWDEDRNEAVLLRGSTLDTCERSITTDRELQPRTQSGQRLHILALLPDYGIDAAARHEEAQQRRQVWEALRDAGTITYDEINPVTLRALNDYLRDDSHPHPAIIHYLGRGAYRNGEGNLVFDDGRDGYVLVNPGRLDHLFGDVRLIVLDACQPSMVDIDMGSLSEVVPSLSLVADAVVAMQLWVNPDAAARFREVFYDELLRKGRSLQEAVAKGRETLFLEEVDGASWYAPTLTIRTREPAPLYLVQRAEPEENDERSSLERRLRAHQRNLQVLEVQMAEYGTAGPLQLLNALENARAQVAEVEAGLRALDSGVVAEQPPVQPEAATTLGELWQQAAYRQRAERSGAVGKHADVVLELDDFAKAFCKRLDFRLLGDFYNHHNQFVACKVGAPTLHLNLPVEFLLILMLAGDVSESVIAELSGVLSAEEPVAPDLIDEIADIPKMMGLAVDFGLVVVTGAESRVQQMINAQIRPAMKTDLIALGPSFINALASPTIPPRTLLLNAILREVDLTRVSPFMAGGAALTSTMFFGREGELRNIAEAVTKTSVAVTCGRRIGKTTLLNRLASGVLPGRGHPCFFLNCQPANDYAELKSEMVKNWQRPDLPFDPEQPNSFSAVVDAVRGDSSKPPIFLLDEVDVLLRYDSERDYRLFKQLRALSLNGRARFVMTGERTINAQIHNANSPLFNFFGLNVRLSFLDRASVNKLVVEPLADMRLELRDPPGMLATINDVTSGHPYLVQRLCQALVKTVSVLGVRVIAPEHMEACLDDSEYQEDYFETVWGQAPDLARIITLLLGKEGTTLKQLRARLSDHGLAPPLKEIDDAMNLLDLYSIAERKGGRYHFVATGFPLMLERSYGDDLETQIELMCEGLA
ncbi:MAG: CHAT domain-containing protein, partial [Chloroflexales bacterium]|nr:CHAT domain-containing protein [Chloroflexales bacterium]